MRLKRSLVLLALVACSRSPTPPVASTPSASASASASAAPVASASATAAATAAKPPPRHPERAFALPADPSCQGDLRCLVEHAYAGDAQAKTAALALFDQTGDVAGTEYEQTMDGGFRGTLHILPVLPTGDARAQLERVLAAVRDLDTFFRHMYPAVPTGETQRYRWHDITFRFFRSASGPAGHETPRTTPSAFAVGPRPMPHGPGDDIAFSLAYNVRGSLLRTETGVRETLFHEMFHMNDDAHHDWSSRALAADYAAIVRKCGTGNVACLRPYAPNDTMVRGGTFYAFQPNNGGRQGNVHEYAAELALRWYKEHLALMHHQPLPGGRAFKCGPPENRRSWDALVKEFFAIDLVPPCP
jgi:hypothetical protein